MRRGRGGGETWGAAVARTLWTKTSGRGEKRVRALPNDTKTGRGITVYNQNDKINGFFVCGVVVNSYLCFNKDCNQQKSTTMYGKIKEHLRKELADIKAAGLYKNDV